MATKKGWDNKSFVPNSDEIGKETKKESTADGVQSVAGVNAPDDQIENRATWGNSLEFVMSCIAMNVGLGNIWRFPFVAYENGGGAFLIPYITVLLFMGRPMYYLEMCLGQFSSRGNVKMFESLAPILKGVGYGQLIGTICVASYYCSLMAITLFYFVNSFTSNLPWSSCYSSWENISWLENVTCVASKTEDFPWTYPANGISSAELWFRVEVLREKPDISDGLGYPEWKLTVCLFVGWLVTFSVCAKGVQTSGKASYFLAIFPFVILAALLIRSVTLEGSGTGILYFIEPKWSKLLSAKVWYNAVTQCLFSLNIGFGSVTMYASYNSFRHNVYRDAMVVTTLDTFTSLLAGTIIFGIVGNLAHKMGVGVDEVVKSGGTGLAFISYPEAIARFEAVPWLFAILFFLVLFILGVGSLVALQGCAFTVVMDSFPHLKIWHVSLATAVAGFLVGLVYITPGGQWIFTMVDFFGGTFIFYILTIVEIVSIMWWYGLENICLDIEFMLKRKPNFYWRICWGFLIPVVLSLVLAYFLVTLEGLRYEKKPYPTHIIVWGWAILGFGLFQPFLWAAIEIVKRNKRKEEYKNSKEVIQSLFQHTAWGPKDLGRHSKWKNFKERRISLKPHRNWFINKLCILVGK